MVDSKENYKFDLGVKGLKTHEKVVEAKAFKAVYGIVIFHPPPPGKDPFTL